MDAKEGGHTTYKDYCFCSDEVFEIEFEFENKTFFGKNTMIAF